MRARLPRMRVLLMMDVCAVCDHLVDVDHRSIAGFDSTRPVLCGGDKCRMPAEHRYMCSGCDKRVAELVEADFSNCIGRPPPEFIHHGKCCQRCADRHAKMMADTEIGGHPV